MQTPFQNAAPTQPMKCAPCNPSSDHSAQEVVREQTYGALIGMTNSELKGVDPVIMNLLVAKEIPALSNLQMPYYVESVDKWEQGVRRGLASAEPEFYESPQHWKNDINFFRLGYVCYYLDCEVGIRYREDQRDNKPIAYTNASDLFLNGVIDTHQGTCANMALLHVALGWRMRWPVSLACVWAHFICRYDDGHTTHNIEATKTGDGGFHSHPDDYYMEKYNLPTQAVQCGSDLRALTPREMLGIFIGARGRYYQDVGKMQQCEADYLLARSMFPSNRYLHFAQIMSSIQRAAILFHPRETGHPRELSRWLRDMVAAEPRNVQ